MLPHYNSKRKPLTRWERIASWFEEAMPYIYIFYIITAIHLFVWWIMPKCPECDEYVHPMAVYCSECGHQLRTTE